MKKKADNVPLIEYFDKYQAFCFDLRSDSVLKGDLNFNYKFPVKIFSSNTEKVVDMNALELQQFYLDKVQKYIYSNKMISYEEHLVLKHWKKVIKAMKGKNIAFLMRNIDWAIKYRIFDEMLPKKDREHLYRLFGKMSRRKFKKILLGKRKLSTDHKEILQSIRELFVVNFLYSDIKNGIYFDLKKNGFLDTWNFLTHYGDVPPKNRVLERILIMRKLKEKGLKAKVCWDKIVFWDKFNKKRKLFLSNPYGGNIDTTGKFLSLIENLSSSPSFKVYDI